MHLRFSHFLYGISCLCLVYALPIFAEEGCSLSDTSSSPIQSYKEKIDTLNTFVRKQADASSCEASASPAARMDGSISLMKEVSSLGTSGTEFLDETGSFLDPAGPLNELQAHRENIEEIEQSILETAQYVGSRCARGQQVSEDAFQGQSAYDTRGRALSGILIEMAKETRETKRFFTILGQGIQTEEYIDEVPFPIASKGFSKDMYVYYSPKKLQECRDNSPRKQAMIDMIKSAFTAGWKYPQAMQVWKDAMNLLLYRGSQIGGGASDAGKDAQIDRIVRAKRGGLGNSDIMINSQFFKEFGYRPDTKTTEESVQGLEKKTFYEKTGYDFIRRVLPSLTTQEGGPDGPGYIKNVQTTEELEKIARLEQLDESHYNLHNTREESLAKSSEDARKNGTEFAQTIEGYQDGKKILDATDKSVCEILDQDQALNVPRAYRC